MLHIIPVSLSSQPYLCLSIKLPLSLFQTNIVSLSNYYCRLSIRLPLSLFQTTSVSLSNYYCLSISLPLPQIFQTNLSLYLTTSAFFFWLPLSRYIYLYLYLSHVMYIHLLSQGSPEWNNHSHHFAVNYHFFQTRQRHEVTHNCLYHHLLPCQSQVFSNSSLICNICHRDTWQRNQHRAKREVFCALWHSNDGL